MSDNTTLNPGALGDVYRSVERDGVKTQVVLSGDFVLQFLGDEQIVGLSSVKTLNPSAGALMALATPSGQGVRWRIGADPTAAVGQPVPLGAQFRYDAVGLSSVRFVEMASSATLDVAYFGKV